MIPEEQTVPACLLGVGGERGDPARIGELVERRQEDPVLHPAIIPRPARRAAFAGRRVARVELAVDGGSGVLPRIRSADFSAIIIVGA